MTRPKSGALVLVGVLAAAGVAILLWCAWLVLTAPLPNGAAAAAWTLWLLSVAALVTLVAYLREMVSHGRLADRASWKPLPGLVLLWVAGLTAVSAFPFVLPERTAGPSQETTAGAAQPEAPAPTTGTTTTSRTLPTQASRATRSPRTTATASATTSTTRPTTPTRSATPASTRTPAPTTTSSTPTPPSSSSTTSPLISITLPHGPGRPTDKPPPPGHG